MEETKSKRGGRRPGAGRKKPSAGSFKVVLPYRVPLYLVNEVQRRADANARPASDEHAEALAKGLGVALRQEAPQ